VREIVKEVSGYVVATEEIEVGRGLMGNKDSHRTNVVLSNSCATAKTSVRVSSLRRGYVPISLPFQLIPRSLTIGIARYIWTCQGEGR